MTTITRQQLRDAIEAGVLMAAPCGGFTAEHAAALRAVGVSATVVARGTFGPLRDGVCCPLTLAVPDWAGRGKAESKWHQPFVSAYDRATYEAIGRQVGVSRLHITDNDESRGVAT
jgi:hypothetical protein